MSIKEIKPWAETDKAARDLLRRVAEREEPIDGCIILCFDKDQSGEMLNSGLTRQEVTYLMTFMQAHVLLQFQENMN